MIKTLRQFIEEAVSSIPTEPHPAVAHLDNNDHENLSRIVHDHLSEKGMLVGIKNPNPNYMKNLFHIYHIDGTPKKTYSKILYYIHSEHKNKQRSFMKNLIVAHKGSLGSIMSRHQMHLSNMGYYPRTNP